MAWLISHRRTQEDKMPKYVLAALTVLCFSPLIVLPQVTRKTEAPLVSPMGKVSVDTLYEDMADNLRHARSRH
jgi:hypothetical protein